jgi:hypothetical protein
MFEIVMLFAFLYAAISQLFPADPTTTRARSVRTPRHDSEKPMREPDPEKKRQPAHIHQANRGNCGGHITQVA